jgi:hypothetical protein
MAGLAVGRPKNLSEIIEFKRSYQPVESEISLSQQEKDKEFANWLLMQELAIQLSKSVN